MEAGRDGQVLCKWDTWLCTQPGYLPLWACNTMSTGQGPSPRVLYRFGVHHLTGVHQGCLWGCCLIRETLYSVCLRRSSSQLFVCHVPVSCLFRIILKPFLLSLCSATFLACEHILHWDRFFGSYTCIVLCLAVLICRSICLLQTVSAWLHSVSCNILAACLVIMSCHEYHVYSLGPRTMFSIPPTVGWTILHPWSELEGWQPCSCDNGSSIWCSVPPEAGETNNMSGLSTAVHIILSLPARDAATGLWYV